MNMIIAVNRLRLTDISNHFAYYFLNYLFNWLVIQCVNFVTAICNNVHWTQMIIPGYMWHPLLWKIFTSGSDFRCCPQHPLIGPLKTKFESWIPPLIKSEFIRDTMRYGSYEIWIRNPGLFVIWILNLWSIKGLESWISDPSSRALLRASRQNKILEMHPLLFITFDPWSEYVKNKILKFSDIV